MVNWRALQLAGATKAKPKEKLHLSDVNIKQMSMGSWRHKGRGLPAQKGSK